MATSFSSGLNWRKRGEPFWRQTPFLSLGIFLCYNNGVLISRIRERERISRVYILILVDQELEIVVEIDVGRKAFFKVEYEWVPARCTSCKVLRHAPCNLGGQRKEKSLESSSPEADNLPLVATQEE